MDSCVIKQHDVVLGTFKGDKKNVFHMEVSYVDP